jgi:flagellar hook-length control protein FliK
MAIEVAPKAAGAPKAGAAPDARGAKSAGKPDAGGGNTGGFMAILSALDQPTDGAQQALVQPDAAPQGASLAAAQDLPENQTQADSGALAIASTATNLAPPTTPVAPMTSGVAATAAPSALPAIALATSTAINSPAPDVLAGGTPSGPMAKAPAAPAGADTSLQVARSDANGTASASPAANATGTAWATSRAKALARAANQGDAGAPAGQPSATPETQMASRVHDVRWFAAMQAQRNAAPTAEVAASQFNSNAAANPERGSSERYTAAKLPTDLLPGGSAPEASPAGNGPSAVSEMAAVAAEQPESVKYWMSQDVQNAELQVDGLGNGPVEVQISLQGNEAHVAFRSDESETLSLLQAAGTDLKESLQREGVVLMGVSVGTSGSQDGRGGERKPRQNVKIAQIAAAQNAPAQAAARPAGGAPRTVDLFV